MSTERYEEGDMVFARVELRNDGSIPDFGTDAQLVRPGTRGMVIKVGSLDHAPEEKVCVVRFEGSDGALGAPVGARADELTHDASLVAACLATTNDEMHPPKS